MNAFLGDILPEGIGRPCSVHDCIDVAIIVSRQSVSGQILPLHPELIESTSLRQSGSQRKDAVRAEPKAVKINRYHIFGLVGSVIISERLCQGRRG